MSDAWRVAKRMRRSEWCERNLRIPEEFAAAGSRFDLRRFPWSREIIDMADDPEVRSIVVMGSTQVAKTMGGYAIMISDAMLDPAPMMAGFPDEKALKYARNLIYGICDESPALRGRVPEPHLRNYEMISFGRAAAYLGISGSPQTLSGKPARKCFATEVDRWRLNPREGKTAKLIAKRVRVFYRYLLYYDGTPTGPGSVIAKLYREGDRRKFHVQCPHCGRWQELRFFPMTDGKYAGRGGVVGIKDEQGRMLDPDSARESAFYRCLNGCEITNEDKQSIVPNGRWVPHGQRLTRKGKLRGTPTRGKRQVSYHISTLYALTQTFGDTAAEWLSTKDDPQELQTFYNNDLGLPFRVRGSAPKWRTIGRRLAGQHQRGTVPAWAIFLTVGADVQLDHVHWCVRAWGEDCTSALVDFGRFDFETGEGGYPIKGSDLAQLDKLMDREFPLVALNPAGEEFLRPWYLGVDMQYRTLEVHNWSRQSQHAARIRMLAGESNIVTYWTYSVVEKSVRTNRPYPGGLKRWGINSDLFRSDLQNRWNTPITQAGAWMLFADAVELAEPYLRELVNEVPTYKRSVHGKTYRQWQKVNPGLGNHAWDYEVLARAVAEMAVENNWKNLAARATPRPKPAQTARPTQTVEPIEGSSGRERFAIRRPGQDWLRR